MDLAGVRFPPAADAEVDLTGTFGSNAPVPLAHTAAAGMPPVAPSAAEYVMIAPVELLFSDGGPRVGIRPGTAAFLKYQRLAAVLLGDLRKASGR
jgi:hypothetical protein